MAKSKSPFKMFIGDVADRATHQNFQEIHKAMSEMSPHVNGKMTDSVSLSVGDNKIKPPIAKPHGKHIIYQSGVANIFDKGLDADGNWVINSDAPVTVKLIFF